MNNAALHFPISFSADRSKNLSDFIRRRWFFGKVILSDLRRVVPAISFLALVAVPTVTSLAAQVLPKLTFAVAESDKPTDVVVASCGRSVPATGNILQ